MTQFSYPAVQETCSNETDHRRQLARGLNNVLAGKMNAVTTLTLTANSATTAFTDARLTINSFIGLMPTTANAAAALANVYVSAQNSGTATFTHANNAQTDRSFKVLIIG